MNNNFQFERFICNKESAVVSLYKDKTCIKKVYLPKYYSRLENEAQCLKILNGNIAPKLISYNEQEHELRMEYINGLTLVKYNKIPKWFFAKLVTNLLELLDNKIDYGEDKKYGEHFIIENGTNNLRIIDFGISDIIDNPEIIKVLMCYYRRIFAFIFNESKDDEQSKEVIKSQLLLLGIKPDIIDNYFNDYETI